MAKYKAPTPQEIYKARKQREEDEKHALLPPGLINHGNTCFMNSVLQGLIATRLLSDLFQFKPLPQHFSYSSTPILSQRSPLLTNGHGLGGGQFDEKWVEDMPLGEAFLRVMLTAWNVQQAKRRENLSPKVILAGIGRKYDQYLDFAQQDAHEFLRQLLDAMRMEELDVIKKRQQPMLRRSKGKGSLSKKSIIAPPSSDQPAPSTSLPSSSSTLLEPSPPDPNPSSTSSSSPSDQDPDPDNTAAVSTTTNGERPPLTSFADMLFGGKLTSILVCQKCKHISQTYEDFNDLSLSITTGRGRERERDGGKRQAFKNLAKKLKTTIGIDMQRAALGMEEEDGVEENGRVESAPVRSSSVPPSPNRRDSGGLGDDDGGTDDIGEMRRRSLDFVELGNTKEERTEGRGSALRNEIAVDSSSAIETPEGEGVDSEESANANVSLNGVVEDVGGEGKKLPDRVDSKIGFLEPMKDSKKDGWTKLSRRISMTVGFGMGAKEKSRERRSRSRDSGDRTTATTRRPHSEDTVPRHIPQASSSSASDIGYITAPEQPTAVFSPSSSSLTSSLSVPVVHAPRAQSVSTLPTSSTSPSVTPVPPLPRFPSLQRSSTTSRLSPPSLAKVISPHAPIPKPSSQEAAYLRKILADIVPASSSSLPFALFKQHPPGTANSMIWMKTAGIEECLRMFTAVEVLEGENKVGCRRCWKMANGVYERSRKGDDSDDDDGDGDDEGSGGGGTGADKVPSDSYVEHLLQQPTLPIRPASAPSTPMSPYVMLPSLGSSTSLDDVFGSSIPTTVSSSSIPKTLPPPLAIDDHLVSSPDSPPTSTSYGGVPIPSISTTAPLSPDVQSPPNDLIAADATSRDSLHAPRPTLRSRRKPKIVDLESTDDSSNEADSDTSESTSAPSDESSSVSALASTPEHPATFLKPPPHATPTTTPTPKTRSQKSKQVLMRPAYKRYLIATPPPILVIHLKRFQQLAKVPIMSFSNGFKKLDDYVAYPEELDLGPFLAPRKEDFGLSRKKKGKGRRGKDGDINRVKKNGFWNGKEKEPEKCMYRLYAVVVHIGNIVRLGGHYVAYTALPPAPPSSLANGAGTTTSTSTNAGAFPGVESARSPRQWAYISDTVVRLTTLDEVLNAKAYICMYERI